MTNDEAIYCMKSYINSSDYEHCINCSYYGKNKINNNGFYCESKTAHNMAIKALEKQKTGHWKNGVCDKCNYDWSKVAPLASVPKFCPNCGAKMNEVE